MAASTKAANPAAGPLTLKLDELNTPITTPPTIPEMIPLKKGAPEASAIPKHKGNATRNVLQLQEVGDFEDGNCLPPLNLIRSTKFNLTTEPPISCRCC
jgi:hypothetical protein